jgi:hypothetical protein
MITSLRLTEFFSQTSPDYDLSVKRCGGMGSPVREYPSMRKSVFVLAVIGAACSSMAFAAEIKKDKAHIPAVKATTMSDADMDKVTAGAGFGNLTADGMLGPGRGNPMGDPGANGKSPVNPGFGNCTAGKC